jgi:hypothetical protein
VEWITECGGSLESDWADRRLFPRNVAIHAKSENSRSDDGLDGDSPLLRSANSKGSPTRFSNASPCAAQPGCSWPPRCGPACVRPSQTKDVIITQSTSNGGALLFLALSSQLAMRVTARAPRPTVGRSLTRFRLPSNTAAWNRVLQFMFSSGATTAASGNSFLACERGTEAVKRFSWLPMRSLSVPSRWWSVYQSGNSILSLLD